MRGVKKEANGKYLSVTFLIVHFFDNLEKIYFFFAKSCCCYTALLKAEFFIEPPPDTQRKGRRGERGTGVARGSYLSLTSLPSSPPRHASVAPPAATLSGLAEGRPLPLPTAPPLPMAKISDFQGFRLKARTASI